MDGFTSNEWGCRHTEVSGNHTGWHLADDTVRLRHMQVDSECCGRTEPVLENLYGSASRLGHADVTGELGMGVPDDQIYALAEVP